MSESIERRPNDVELEKLVFKFLLDLRDSGTTNMFFAGSHLMAAFGFSKDEAQDWLFRWMSSLWI